LFLTHVIWILGALSRGIKQSAREADHSPPSSSEDKDAASSTLIAYVIKYRDNFTFALQLSVPTINCSVWCVNVNLSLCLIKHQAIITCDQFIYSFTAFVAFSLDGCSFMPRPLYTRGKAPTVYIGYEAWWTLGPVRMLCRTL
jgi:hypothetical protein